MAKTSEEILKEFQKELMENDKLVQQEINTKDRDELNKEFVEFVKKNNCKIMKETKNKGGKNGK